MHLTQSVWFDILNVWSETSHFNSVIYFHKGTYSRFSCKVPVVFVRF